MGNTIYVSGFMGSNGFYFPDLIKLIRINLTIVVITDYFTEVFQPPGHWVVVIGHQTLDDF